MPYSSGLRSGWTRMTLLIHAATMLIVVHWMATSTYAAATPAGGVLYQSNFRQAAAEWDLAGPGWAVAEGILSHGVLGYGDAFVGDPEWRDYTVTARVRVHEFGEYGGLQLMVRQLGPWMMYTVTLDPTSVTLRRYDGTWRNSLLLRSAARRIEVGKEYMLQVTVRGTQASVSLDGVALFTANIGSAYPKGRIGFRANNARIDILDVRVEGDTSHQSPLLAVPQAADEIPTRQEAGAYFPPGTDASGGVSNIMMVYTGYYSSGQGVWSMVDALPYVAYGQREETAGAFPRVNYVDWFFDTFLFLGLQAPSGRAFDSALRAEPARMEDWQWYLDRLFEDGQQLDAFAQAVQLARQRVVDPDHKIKVLVMIPNPIATQTDFGDVDGDGVSENFTLIGQTVAEATAARLRAVRWYIDQFERRLNERQYDEIEFIGYYWLEERIQYGAPQEVATLREVADYVHGLGRKFFWFPYFQSDGYDRGYAVGFDVVIMQPNYMFDTSIAKSRLEAAAELARKHHLGIEIEADGTVLSSPAGRQRYLDYLRAGVEYGYMDDAVKSYYLVVDVLFQAFASRDPELRRLYDATYEFVKGKFSESLE